MAIHAPSVGAMDQESVNGRYVYGGIVAGLAAALVNVTMAFLAHRAGADLELPQGGEAIPLLAFPQLTLVGSFLGVGLARLLRTFSRRPAQTFTWTCVVLTLVSLVPPIAADATPGTTGILVSAHLVSAGIVVPTIARRLLPSTARRIS